MRLYRRLLPLAALLALAVVGLGAWVRLSDAGLGCPDWPGCYGQLLGVPEHAADSAKAWKEMIHRYLAGTLGLSIVTLALLAWRLRPKISPLLPSLLCVIVIFQAALGMWTVTLRLKPLIVTAHLLGGMSTLALLVWLNLQLRRQPIAVPDRRLLASPRLKAGALLALALLIVQIALGGWVSSNYAALACPDFPTCQGHWLPAMDFSQAYRLQRPLGYAADGSLLTTGALTAIHWSHRLGALVVGLALAALALALRRRPGGENFARLLLALLALQLSLGIANVVLSLPLPLAFAHNIGAALLLCVVVAINFRLWQESQ